MTGRIILGLTEQVTIISELGEVKATARIDTGATFSSLDTALAAKLKLGPTNRSKIIKSASGTLKRMIVHAKVKVAGVILEGEFSLADRSHMTYSILLGQNILRKGNFLIDPKKDGE